MAIASPLPAIPTADAAIAELEEVASTPQAPDAPSETNWMTRLMHLVNRLTRTRKPQPRKHEPIPEFRHDASSSASSTTAGGSDNILYLAYGSNLCAATFQDSRGIRPKSAANVWVPELELTFDLPGIPYSEPCFANTRYRRPSSPSAKNNNNNKNNKDQTHGEVPASERDPLLAPPVAPSEKIATATALGWGRGLIGVVYEVTPEEWAHIMITEGGGSSYADVEVVCHPLGRGDADLAPASDNDSSDKPSTFIAHTLLARNDPIYKNRREGYAQPSKRYLGLLTTGAKEHKLPGAYQEWLRGLQPYTITSRRQQVGRVLLSLTFFPWIVCLFVLQRLTADKSGRSAPAVGRLMKGMFGLAWRSYDYVFKPLFGEGERTEER